MNEFTELDVEIILILSDNKGHPRREMIELFNGNRGKPDGRRIDKSLRHLQEESEYGEERIRTAPFVRWINSNDIKDPLVLTSKILAEKDPVSHLIHEHLSPESIQTLKASNNRNELRLVLSNELNDLIGGPCIFDGNIFAEVKLTDRTKKEMEKGITGWGVHILNRLLLEDAYPAELSKRWKSTISRSDKRYTTAQRLEGKQYREEPFFLNQDMGVFKHIIEDINTKKERIHRNKVELSSLLDAKLKDVQYKSSLTAGELDEVKMKLNDETQLEGHNMSYWEELYGKNNERLEKFLQSEYVHDLIREYGISDVLKVTKHVIVESKTHLKIVESAFEKKLISEEEMNIFRKRFDIFKDIREYIDESQSKSDISIVDLNL